MAEDLEEKCQLFTFLIKRGGEGGCIFFSFGQDERHQFQLGGRSKRYCSFNEMYIIYLNSAFSIVMDAA